MAITPGTPLASGDLPKATADAATNAADVRTALGLGTAATEDIPYVNVKSAPYNATGDGVTDDTAAIQSALNAAGDTQSSLVFLPSGTYKISDTLVLKNPGTQVFGDGIYKTTINQTVAEKHGFALDGYTAATGGNAPQGCVISDMRINGLGYATHTGSGIYLRREGSTNFISGVIKIDRVWVQGFARGIYARKFWRLFATDFRAEQNLIGVHLDANDTYAFKNCSIGASTIPSGSGSIGFKLEGANFGGSIENGEYGDLDCFIENAGNTVTVFEPNVERCGDATGQTAVALNGSGGMTWFGGRIENGNGDATTAIFRCLATVANGTPTLSICGAANFGNGTARIIEVNGDARYNMRVFSTARYPITTSLAAGGTADNTATYSWIIPTITSVTGLSAVSSSRGMMAYLPAASGVSDALCVVSKNGSDVWSRRNIINDSLVRVLNDTATVSTNTGTGATTIYTTTVPANAITATKQTIRFKAFGKFAATANNKRLQMDFGNGIAIYDSGSVAINNSDWEIEAIITYQTNGNYSAVVRANCNDALLTNRTQVTKTIARFSNTSNVLNLVATGGATADIELLWAQTIWMKNDSEY